mmetsp:Transcript_20989/g.33519  ORF Transcript_20989/g.33519 Transcript_20989/m.33519 type:complete len:478 (-) Transcript_20989:235-1668(-)
MAQVALQANDANGLQLDDEFSKLKDNETEINKTKQLYEGQCQLLLAQQKQADLWKTLTLGRTLNIPLLPYMIDAYTRDKLDSWYRPDGKQTELHRSKWCESALPALSKKKRNLNSLQAALSTFFTRYASEIQLRSGGMSHKYEDSIEAFTEYMVGGVSFIKTVMEGDLVAPPFQVDMLIIPKKVVDGYQAAGDKHDSDDDDDDDEDFDDDDDEEDEEEDNDDQKADADSRYKHIKELGPVLNEHSVQYETLTPQQAFRGRDLHEMWKNLKHKLQKDDAKAAKEEMQENNAPNKAAQNDMKVGDMPKLGELQFALPHKNRLVIVVDRRKCETNAAAQSEIFMYRPPLGGAFPNNTVPEWHFQASFECVIPGHSQHDTITAKSLAGGYVFCLSFQIEQANAMKCYLYAQSQMIRFFPEDIATLLPDFFVMGAKGIGAENTAFVSKEKQGKEKQKAMQLPDDEFEKFRKQVNMNAKRRAK